MAYYIAVTHHGWPTNKGSCSGAFCTTFKDMSTCWKVTSEVFHWFWSGYNSLYRNSKAMHGQFSGGSRACPLALFTPTFPGKFSTMVLPNALMHVKGYDSHPCGNLSPVYFQALQHITQLLTDYVHLVSFYTFNCLLCDVNELISIFHSTINPVHSPVITLMLLLIAQT